MEEHMKLIQSFLYGKSLLFSLAFLCLVSFSGLAQKLDMSKLENMKARNIGPAGMSGRVTAIGVVRKNPAVIYLGSASGGLWKSVSGGVKWDPIFDTMAVASIGAIALDQNNPDVIWVGTGEGNPRNSQTSGNGAYKSLDGGHSWIHLGLEKTRNIHRVILDPTNSNVAYVAAIGTAFGETPERGVYKTTDGGATWQRVMFVDEKTGCAELVMDPNNPNKLIAAMWQYRRWPWFFKSGGPGSGLYVTFDGGKTWKKRTDEDGLPKGELGRIGLAVSASNPDRVYAIVESKKNALYRSDDGGFKWKKMSDSNNGNRPFYYHEIYVDPTNENRVYSLYSSAVVSEDGGKTFENLIGGIHGDHHALYIHPDNPNFLIDGNDGGAAISYDRGKTWRFIANLPLGQFYHINVDAQTPYRVYGGLQDNGSWCGPAYAYQWSPIRNSQWDNVGWGDGFDVVPDRSNPRYCYSMSQGGYLNRVDMQTNESRFIRPIHPSNIPLRFNWNAGISSDPFSPTTIYYGSQFLHTSTNRGDTWQIISPDLTTNDTMKQKQLESGGLTYDVTAAENHCTIIAIAPSPVQRGVIWVGTDDGNVQVTTNAGATWTNVVRNIKGVPESTWVPQIQPSSHNAGEAFVVFDNHRRNDWTPYVFRTADFGKSWSRLVDDKDVWGYALSFVQDPVEPKLMFVGTEFGLYVTVDGGETWTKWKAGYPTVSTMDLAIQSKESDLVIGTFGRSVFVLDDIRPLREIVRRGTTVLDQPLHVFEIPDAALTRFKWIVGGGFGHGDGEFYGENRPYGARISFVVNPPDTTKEKGSKDEQKHADSAKESRGGSLDSATVEVLKMNGELLRTFIVSVKKGINRTTWGLDRKSERMPSRPKPEAGTTEPGGWDVMPGTYRVRLTYLKHVDSTTVVVKADPRLEFTEAEMIANTAFFDTIYQRVRLATDAADRLRDAKKTIEQIGSLIKERSDSTAKKVKDLGTALQDSIKRLMEMIDDREVQGIRNDPSLLESRIGAAMSYAGSSWYPPGETERTALQQAVGSLKKLADTINTFFERDWPKYKDVVDAAKITFFEPYVPINVDQ
jgi:photosystem II stability/assembly factor-like uncharacterized protein